MTRDRPSSGGQDSTVEGKFPSELGGDAARVEPRKISSVFGHEPHSRESNDDRGRLVYPKNQLYMPQVGLSPILRIKDDIVSSELSGIYKFTSPEVLNYDTYETEESNETIEEDGTINLEKEITFTGVNVGDVRLFVEVKNLETESVGLKDLKASLNVNNLTATHFPTYVATSPAISFYNQYSIPSEEFATFSMVRSLMPAYQIEWMRSIRMTKINGVVPNSDTTFSITGQVFNRGTAKVNIQDARIGVYGIKSFDRDKIDSTIESEL